MNYEHSSTITRRVKRLLSGYLIRKYDSLSADQAREIAMDVNSYKCFTRVRFNTGLETQTAGVYFDTRNGGTRKSNGRADVYIACEMDCEENTCDVFYGRILHLIRVDIASPFLPCTDETSVHDLVVIEWAMDLERGNQEPGMEDWKL